ncbi:hypothetical protein ACFO0J_15155 [Castellaniella hirudinis]|uniref:Uncharacterized protein n=1 Tax=Castellaniella hirudinis TaxID=1144617 RepID=A0ABV8S496_9BURK
MPAIDNSQRTAQAEQRRVKTRGSADGLWNGIFNVADFQTFYLMNVRKSAKPDTQAVPEHAPRTRKHFSNQADKKSSENRRKLARGLLCFLQTGLDTGAAFL